MLESVSLWNKLHASPRFRPAYPSEHVVRFLLATHAALGPDSPRHFLDIGTGAGRHITLAAEIGFSPIGMDLSWTGLRHARERLATKGLPHALVSAGMAQLPFADQSFSAVLSYGVFCYGTAEGMKRAINEAWRVMYPGGRLLAVLRSTRDYRYGRGRQVEPNTFRLDIADTNELGTIQHFLDEAAIPEYFAGFSQVTFESSELTFGNRSRLDSDWLITAQK